MILDPWAAAEVADDPNAPVLAYARPAAAWRRRYDDTRDVAALVAALDGFRAAAARAAPATDPRLLTDVRVSAGTAALLLAQHDPVAAEAPHLLAAAVADLREAVEGAPDDASRARAATNLAAALRERGDLADLTAAADVLVPAVTARLPAAVLALVATTLGHVESDLYDLDGDLGRLDRAEAAYRVAVDATGHGAAARGPRRAHLAAVGIERWRAAGDLDVLLRGIALLEDALAGSGGRTPVVLTNGAVALRELFEATGDRSTLDRAVALLVERGAVEPDDPDGNLRAAVARRAELFGGDRSSPRSVLREPDRGGVSGRAAGLVNRAAAAFDAYDATGRVADLQEAIAAYRAALDATPARSPRRPARLADLASALRERAHRLGSSPDLEDAAALLAEADSGQAGGPDVARRHAALAQVLLDRVGRGAPEAEAVAAIEYARRALAAAPPGSHDLPSRLGLLGACLLEAGRLSGDANLVDEAVVLHRRALDLVEADDPARFRYRQNLGDALCERGAGTDHIDGVALLRAVLKATDTSAVSTAAADPGAAVAAARNWCAAATRLRDWPQVAEAAVRGLAVVATTVGGQDTRRHREGWLRDARTLPASGAYALARLGRPAAAALILDRGRAVLLARALADADR